MNYIEKHLGCSKSIKAILEQEWLLFSKSANLSAINCTLQYQLTVLRRAIQSAQGYYLIQTTIRVRWPIKVHINCTPTLHGLTPTSLCMSFTRSCFELTLLPLFTATAVPPVFSSGLQGNTGCINKTSRLCTEVQGRNRPPETKSWFVTPSSESLALQYCLK